MACHCSSQAGWNKLKCTACGINVLTDTLATNGLAFSTDQCYLPAGWGSALDSNKKLVARKCNKGMYESDADIYGVVPHPCQVGICMYCCCTLSSVMRAEPCRS